MATGYEDIDKLTSQKQTMLNEALKQQNDIVNKQTQMSVDNLERQKADIEKNATQTNKALYQDYKKTSNPFGAQAENLASQGLGNSGYAETTQANLYNTYQQNITSTLNNARDLKADVDFQIQQARQTGNITIAQNALELYRQRMQLLSEEYELRNNREQFLYQKEQDALSQNNWEREFAYNRQVNDRNFGYQLERDRVEDARDERNFNYTKQKDSRDYSYQLNRDAIEDARDQRNFNYQISRNDIEDARDARNYNYQVSRDRISDSQWNKEYNLKKSTSDRDYKYQKSRDKVTDKQWEKEYQLSKKGIASSSRRSSSRRSYKKTSSGSTSENLIYDGGNNLANDGGNTKLNDSQKAVLNNVLGIVANGAKAGLTAMTVGVNLKKGNILSAIKILKSSAGNSLYDANKNGFISDEEADAIAKKFGL